MHRKRQHLLASIAAAIVAIVTAAASAGQGRAIRIPTIIHAKPFGALTGACDTWANACELRYALGVVAVSGDQVWVAAGTYKPTDSPDRTISFALKSGVAVFGGFAGTETSLSQRDPKTNVTILSGDIGTYYLPLDNSYHVVLGSGTISSAILDGFTISGGRADGPWPDHVAGGGMKIDAGSPTLLNLIFTQNYAGAGGGLAIGNGGSPTLRNVTFYGNTAAGSGGGLRNYDGSASLLNVTFYGNAAQWGGAIDNMSSALTLLNVTFSGNQAKVDRYNEGGGSAIYNGDGGTATLTNVILWGDFGGEWGEVLNPNGTMTISHSVVAGGCGAIYTGVTCEAGNLITDPRLGLLTDNGGYTPTMALMAGSSALSAGLDVGCPPIDQRGVLRPQDAPCDMGAYELRHPQLMRLYPADTTQDCLRPKIGVTLELTDAVRTGGSFDRTKVELHLDRTNVTSAATFFESEDYPARLATLLYRPPANLAPGSHEVILAYTTETGTHWRLWNFTAADIACTMGTPQISSPTSPGVISPLLPVEPPAPIMPILP